MIYDIYPLEESLSKSQFEFYSIGPKGKIKKRIVFLKDFRSDEIYYLAFGDIIEDGEINDTVISDNRDSKKILRTVSFAVYEFLKTYSDRHVFAMGSTPARTRLYQIGICNNLEMISQDFELYGLLENKWYSFERGTQYKAFLIKKKIK